MSDILDLLAIEQDRKGNLDAEYAKFRAYADQVEAKYAALSGKQPLAGSLTKLVPFIKDHWKEISVVAAAAGIPIGAADPGAFTGILSSVSGLWPF
jgi:hypothetical protein